MRLWLLLGLVLSFLVVLVIPAQASGQKIHGFSFGYGFGFLSTGKTIGQIEEGHYDFVQFTYQYENPLSEVLGLVIEPFASYTIDPKEGVDAGITLSLKYNFHKKNQNGFFLNLGGGGAYTSINFKEQGTHFLFILHTGLGYKWNNFFIENRFKHYSNADTASPNRSINSNIVMVGMNF